MLSYQTIDTFCDLINPALLLTALASLVYRVIHAKLMALWETLWLVLTLALVYGVRFFDEILGIWPSFNADYSTHTAFALGVSLWLFRQWGKALLWATVLIGYALLMLYQQYHTLLDILSTAAVISMGLTPLWRQRWRAFQSQTQKT